MKRSDLKRAIVLEILERAKLAKIIAAKWVRTGSARDRVKAGTIARHVADTTGDVRHSLRLSPAYLVRVQRACELAGHRQRIRANGTNWVICIKERTT